MYLYRLICILALVIIFTGCKKKSFHDHPSLTTGTQLFKHHCATCHGQKGKGNFLKGIPASTDTQKININ
ncbi:c-type cytochrome [Pseudoalteromonas denitrificans]|jgi:cytochrome c|uniref:Cytochrome c n=1 Tax=Pseudoalteromonas denitrificans DSM 6059 TaxID=1123010 RepID=A0A1I1ERR0_9GAMM|nr:c-type cytochrome [Pseudoalteromonas denitrificans]SFB87600.1 Cytochrome c [Pseudoalteromonas denitrificans DSM 6059]